MAWVKLDDGFFSNPKIVNVSGDAKLLYISALCYSGAHLTDGVVPKGAIRILAAHAAVSDTSEAISELIDAGLWYERERSYEVHDYLDHNTSADEVRTKREQARIRAEERRKKYAESSREQNENSEESSQEVRVPEDRRQKTETEDRNKSSLRSPEREKKTSDEPAKFVEFYEAFPRKKARADALKAWGSIKPDDELAERIVNAVKAQAKTTYKGKDQQYIPYPATWLRAGQWDDEIDDPKKAPDGTLIGMYGGGYNPLKSLSEEELDDYNKQLEAAKSREIERERGVG